MTKKKEKLQEIKLELQNDDLVIVGSPIWNDRLSTPVITALGQLDLNKETTKFILYPAGSGTKKSLTQIEKLGFKETPIIIQYPLKYQEKALELIKNL